MKKIILGGHPVALVGQVKDIHQHHIWCFPLPCTGETISLNAAHIPCNDQWCPHMQHSWHPTDIGSCGLWSYTFHLHSQKMVVIVLWAIYMYMLPNLVVTVNGWIVDSNWIAIAFANLTDITNNVNIRYLWNIHACSPIIEWIVLNVMVYTMKNDWEVVKSLTVKMRIDSSVLINKPYAISCCANCRQLYLLFAHVPKHLQFAQINNKFQSDVNKKLIVQRSELIVLKKKFFWELSQSNWEKL